MNYVYVSLCLSKTAWEKDHLQVASELVGAVGHLKVPRAAVGAGRALLRAVLQQIYK